MALSILFVGDPQHSEFKRALLALETSAELTLGGVGTTAESCQPDYIVIGQRRPGEFDEGKVADLLNRFPLAKAFLLLGGWCEGETRTGNPLPGLPRLYWHQFMPRMAANPLGESQLWHLPRTATTAEILAIANESAKTIAPLMIGVIAPNWVTFEGISEACSEVDWGTVWIRPDSKRTVRGINAMIWDLDGRPDEPIPSLVSLGTPCVALIGFPRLDDVSKITANANVQVVSKPYVNADLIAAVQEVVG